jgi:tetratricopeptide (TPR) repeat protein
MGLFDFFKAEENNKPSFDLTDFKFLSDDHTRIENGLATTANNKGAWRGIRVKTSDNTTFFVTMYNMNENHPIWGDNIQMAEKRMKVVEENNDKIILRGFGIDTMGASFADYGLTLHKSKNDINKVTLHMHDRNIEILYLKAENKKKAETINQYSDYDNFKNFTDKWNRSMTTEEKMQIAYQSDAINNIGADAFEINNINLAINCFEQALTIMPNNDDALKNLIICYSKSGNQNKVNDIEKKLNYIEIQERLSRLG